MPRLEKIILEGLNKKRYKTDLIEILEALLSKNTAITKHLQNEAEIKILDYFEEQRMPNSRVKTAKNYFSGNDNAPTATLRKRMTETKAEQFFGKSEFIEANFEQDKNSILQYFDYSLGFDSETFDKGNWYKSGKFSVILDFDPN